MAAEIRLSGLGKTWILDLDGTIVKHNGYMIDGVDTFLEGAEDFLKQIPDTDMIVFITSRTEGIREATEKFLSAHEVRYHSIIFDAPFGERIVMNDRKPSGLSTAVAVNTKRDQFCDVGFFVDDNL